MVQTAPKAGEQTRDTVECHIVLIEIGVKPRMDFCHGKLARLCGWGSSRGKGIYCERSC